MEEQLIHTTASIIMEIAYLATGIILCMIGKSLLEKGISSKFVAEGEVVSKKFRLITSSPGLVFLVAGMAIIIYAIITPSIFEKRVTSSEHFSESNDTLSSPETTSIVQSRLFDQSSFNAALSSRVAIYALQHRSLNLVNQDITIYMSQMPTEANVEPWTQTYNRFRNILRKNPTALLEILNQPELQWLTSNEQKEQSLTTMIETEIQLLITTYSPAEKE